MAEIDLLRALPRTKRNIQKRKEGKDPAVVAISRQYGEMYFDGPRDYGYGGYRYDGRWVPVARDIVAHFNLKPGMRVLDVGCGDGFYTYLLARRVGETGCVVGLDVLPAYLDYAKRHPPTSEPAGQVQFVEGSLDALPFEPESFDMVWCAQSLYSLPDPVPALRAMRRAVRPGGIVAVLENDTLHQLLLPWPPEVELAIRAAELLALHDESRRPAKFYIGRRLPAVLAAAGLECERLRTQAIDRRAPLGDAERRFLELYFQEMADRIGTYIDAELRRQFDDLIDPRAIDSLLRQPTLSLTWLNMLAIGRNSAAEAPVQ